MASCLEQDPQQVEYTQSYVKPWRTNLWHTLSILSVLCTLLSCNLRNFEEILANYIVEILRLFEISLSSCLKEEEVCL